jgi:hypothetical protein
MARRGAQQTIAREHGLASHLADKLRRFLFSAGLRYGSNFCGCFLHKQVDGFTVILKQLRARCSVPKFIGQYPGGGQETLK